MGPRAYRQSHTTQCVRCSDRTRVMSICADTTCTSTPAIWVAVLVAVLLRRSHSVPAPDVSYGCSTKGRHSHWEEACHVVVRSTRTRQQSSKARSEITEAALHGDSDTLDTSQTVPGAQDDIVRSIAIGVHMRVDLICDKASPSHEVA